MDPPSSLLQCRIVRQVDVAHSFADRRSWIPFWGIPPFSFWAVLFGWLADWLHSTLLSLLIFLKGRLKVARPIGFKGSALLTGLYSVGWVWQQ